MAKTFKVGDHVSWNSEAGRARGRIIKIHKSDIDYKGYMHRATESDPQKSGMGAVTGAECAGSKMTSPADRQGRR